MGGHPRWEVPKDYVSKANAVLREIKLLFRNEWKSITPDQKQFTLLAHVFYVDHYTTGVISGYAFWRKYTGDI